MILYGNNFSRNFGFGILLLCLCFVATPIAYAYENICTSGWGTSSANGEWVYGGVSSDGYDWWYKNDVSGLYIAKTAGGAPRWYIGSDGYVSGTVTTALYGEEPTGQGMPWEVVTWDIYGGSAPKGTVSLGSCATPTPTPTPTPSPSASSTPVMGSTYMFLYTSMIFFLLQEFAILVVFLIMFMLIGWPIRYLMRGIRDLIKRAEY